MIGLAVLIGRTGKANLMIAVGAAGAIHTSEDGKNWTVRTSGSSADLNDVAYNGATYVVVGQGGVILTSTDLVTWTTRTSGTTENFRGVVWAGTAFIAVGSNDTIFTSPSGTTWTSRNPGLIGAYQRVIYGGGIALAVGNSIVASSTDGGASWTPQSTGITGSPIIFAGTWTGSQFLIVGSNGGWATSPDGVTWSPSSGIGFGPRGVAIAGAQIVAVGPSGEIAASLEHSMSWSPVSSGVSDNLLDVKFNGDRFIAVGSDGTTISSSSGLHWEAVRVTSGQTLLGLGG